MMYDCKACVEERQIQTRFESKINASMLASLNSSSLRIYLCCLYWVLLYRFTDQLLKRHGIKLPFVVFFKFGLLGTLAPIFAAKLVKGSSNGRKYWSFGARLHLVCDRKLAKKSCWLRLVE
jgi:hypothetical protein